jgi:hypothetical protein
MIIAMPMQARAQSLGAIGGIGGISGEANEATPLFTMTGTPNFKEGEGSFTVGYLSTRVTRRFGDKIEEREFGADIFAEVTSKVFIMSYGVTDRLAVGSVLSFDTTRIQQGFDTNSDGAIDQVDKTKTSGLSNPSFSAKYTLIRDPNISIRATAKLPSGSYEAGNESPEADLDLAYSVSMGAADLHLQAGYQYTFAGRTGGNPSDVVVGNAALASSFGENFVLFTELNYRQAGGSFDTTPGNRLKDPTQKSLDFTPGMKVRFKESFLFSVASRISLINDFAFGYDYSYLALLSYVF